MPKNVSGINTKSSGFYVSSSKCGKTRNELKKTTVTKTTVTKTTVTKTSKK
jgi:hypothetical protein